MARKNDYNFINRQMKTGIELFKQQMRKVLETQKGIKAAKENLQQNIVNNTLNTTVEQLKDPTAKS